VDGDRNSNVRKLGSILPQDLHPELKKTAAKMLAKSKKEPKKMNAPYLILGLLCGLAIGYAFGWQYQRSVRSLRFPITRIVGWSDARDAARYQKLRGWMSSNVPEGWIEVERMGALCAWESWDAMDAYLDSLPNCAVGLMSKAPPAIRDLT
jgi:hypothetical protein